MEETTDKDVEVPYISKFIELTNLSGKTIFIDATEVKLVEDVESRHNESHATCRVYTRMGTFSVPYLVRVVLEKIDTAMQNRKKT